MTVHEDRLDPELTSQILKSDISWQRLRKEQKKGAAGDNNEIDDDNYDDPRF